MSSCKTKKQLRDYAKRVRKAIPLTRRLEAHQRFISMLPSFDHHSLVLSYASFNDEFDMEKVNRRLIEQGRLLLPKTEKDHTLRIFRVTDIERQLKMGSYGIMEPDPDSCEEVLPSSISLVFVPAVAFDRKKHRLGYGQGCYDRFLSSVPSSTCSIGIGYHEQLMDTPIPVEANDLFLTDLRLF